MRKFLMFSTILAVGVASAKGVARGEEFQLKKSEVISPKKVTAGIFGYR